MKTLDYLIVGAGPAGLQLAFYLQKSDSDYLVLEKADKAGSFFETFPRHRKLISINKVYAGTQDPEEKLRWDWNSLMSDDPSLRLEKYTKEYFPSADQLVEFLSDYAEQLQLKVRYNSEVVNIDKKEGMFHVKTADGQEYQAKAVVMGTGAFKPYLPNIEGIELCDNYVDCSVNTEDFVDQRVLIIGKGNSGFETADHLVGVTSLIHIVSPTPIKFAWQTHFVGHLRAVNNNFLDTYQLKSQNAILDAQVRKISKRDGKYYVNFYYSHANEETEDIAYDKVIVATGFKFDDSIFSEQTRPEMVIDERFPKQTFEWESTNVKDLYFIGVITQQRDYKKHTSAFIHGFRYNSECIAKILQHNYEGQAFPAQRLEYNSEKVGEQLVKRVNQSSSMWQQFGFIGDLVVIDPDQGTAEYLETMPTDYIHQSGMWKDKHWLILTLEYGKFDENENVFAIVRDPDTHKAKDSKFLHPIIRHYHNGELLSEHHIIEDLEAKWTHPERHIQPLMTYLQEEWQTINNSVGVN